MPSGRAGGRRRRRMRKARGIGGMEMAGVQIPFHFRCPISLELMRDPVVVCTGQTYDRASIEQWVAGGNSRCPVTMQRLDRALIPNHALRRMIQEWCVANRGRGIERIPSPKQPADARGVRALLEEAGGSAGGRIGALRALKLLARESHRNRSTVAAEGVVPLLISALFKDVADDDISNNNNNDGVENYSKADLEFAEEALGVLALFGLTDRERASVAQPRRLAYVSWLLRCGSMEVRVTAGSLVESLAAGEGEEGIRSAVGGTPGVVEGLVKLTGEALYPRAVKVGIKGIFCLCLCKANRERAARAGAAEALVERLVDAQKCDGERALAAAELLCRTEAGLRAFRGHALTVPVLVRTILKVSDRATECAAGCLLAVCTHSLALQEEALLSGVVAQLLLVLQSRCTDRAKRKAQTLLKLLRNAWIDDSCAPDTGRTDVVPF